MPENGPKDAPKGAFAHVFQQGRRHVARCEGRIYDVTSLGPAIRIDELDWTSVVPARLFKDVNPSKTPMNASSYPASPNPQQPYYITSFFFCQFRREKSGEKDALGSGRARCPAAMASDRGTRPDLGCLGAWERIGGKRPHSRFRSRFSIAPVQSSPTGRQAVESSGLTSHEAVVRPRAIEDRCHSLIDPAATRLAICFIMSRSEIPSQQ
jgi:hypothetical protein